VKQKGLNRAVAGEIIFRLLDTTINNKAAVVSLLEEIDTWSAKQLLFSDMLNNGEYIQAASFLSGFESSNSEINDWVVLNEILLSLYSNDKTLYEMDSTQLAFVTDLAYKCPSKRGSAGARSIIHMLFGEEVPPCVEMQSRNSRMMLRDVDFVMPDCDAYMEDNFPDPFPDYTLINYYLPQEMTGKIIVNDMFGRIIAEYKLEVGENTMEIINNDWAPGVYSYGMIVNDKAIEFKKMVITQ